MTVLGEKEKRCPHFRGVLREGFQENRVVREGEREREKVKVG